MKILAFDTANAYCSVAIINNNIILDEICSVQVNRQAETLFGIIEAILEQNSLSYNDLDALVVTKGPGSFTGIRIGMASAKGLALITKKPLYGISTLEILAYMASTTNCQKNIHAVLNAGRERAYYQLFTYDLQPLSAPRIIAIEDIKTFGETIASNVDGYGDLKPDAKHAGLLACRKLHASEEMAASPLYVR